MLLKILGGHNMKLEKIVNGFKEWYKNADVAAKGIGKEEAEYVMKQKRKEGLYFYGCLEQDRLAYGEPEVALVLIPVYLGIGIYKGINWLYGTIKQK